jgi:hypothetical protein
LDISGLAVRIIFLLLPGAIASSLYWKLKGRATRKDWEDLLEVVIFSICSYLVYAICTYILGCFNFLWSRLGLQARTFTQFRPFFDEQAPLDLAEIFYVSLLSIPLAVLACYAYEYKWLNVLGQTIGATTRFGNEDIWNLFQQNADLKGKWATVRDHKLNLYYYCWIQAFSDSGKERELFLREVHVYDESAARLLHKTQLMYLSRNSDDLTIEVAVSSPNSEEQSRGFKNRAKVKSGARQGGDRLQRRQKR